MSTLTQPSPDCARSLPRGDRGRTDAELLAEVRGGDLTAYGEIFQRHEPAVRRFANSLVPSSAVDDLVADTFGATLRALHRGRGPTDEPIRYLIVTARTMAYRHYKRQAMTERLVPSHPGKHEVAPEDAVVDDRLVNALATLPSQWREALWCREIEGLDPQAIGERFQISAGAAAALTYRARRGLREAYLAQQAT